MEPSHELPPVQEGVARNLPPAQEAHEVAASHVETKGNQNQQAVPQTQSAMPSAPVITSNTVQHATVQAAPSTGSDSAMIADDADLIEKEWVAKAKQIIEQTKTDPRAQSTELAMVKAEYVKKRYNREIKTSEAS